MPRLTQRQSRIALLLGALVALAAFHTRCALILGHFYLDLGSVNRPTPLYLDFVLWWYLLGSAAWLLIAAALSSSIAPPADNRDRAGSDDLARWLVSGCALAVLIPLLLRVVVLRGAPLADDESAYLFAAKLLDSGRLWVPSPQMKAFFDQNFVVNDGRLYPVYFMGWPALLAIGQRLQLIDLVNPLCSGLTLWGLVRVTTRLVGSYWGRWIVPIYLASPMIQVGAATLLAHTACLMFLAWTLEFFYRATDSGAAKVDHAAFAAFFGAAFWVRPQSAVALGGVLLIFWAASLRRFKWRQAVQAFFVFLVPGLVLAGLFLGVLREQNGSPWVVGYTRYNQYVLANGLAFSTFSREQLSRLAGFDFGSIIGALGRTSSGLFRLNFDLLGWPASFAFLPFAGARSDSRVKVVWAMSVSFLVLALFQTDWGIDTFGPVHAFELALPVLVLTVVGIRNLDRRLSSMADRARLSAEALLAGIIITSLVGFTPIRLWNVKAIADRTGAALRAPTDAHLHNALIFAPFPFSPPCHGEPNHFVFFRPINDPDLHNDVLWVNRLDNERNSELCRLLKRNCVVMTWSTDCTVSLTPLSATNRTGRS
jgi:hypothetical protein